MLVYRFKTTVLTFVKISGLIDNPMSNLYRISVDLHYQF